MMLEPDFMDWLAEHRLNALPEEARILSEEEIITEIMDIFGDEIDLNQKTELALFADRIKNAEKIIYENGIEDGIRLAKWVYSISI